MHELGHAADAMSVKKEFFPSHISPASHFLKPRFGKGGKLLLTDDTLLPLRAATKTEQSELKTIAIVKIPLK